MAGDDRLLLAVLPEAEGQDVELLIASNTTERTFPIPAAGDKSAIRFSVGEPGRRATIWRLWAPPNKDDVYLASRRSANVFKISLHASGDYRMQWVAKDRTGAFFHGPSFENSRIMHQWERPNPTIAGWTEALGLQVSSADVVEVPNDPEKYTDVQWLTAVPPAGVIQFRIIIVQPGMSAYDMTKLAKMGIFTYINGFQLAGGEVVLLIAVTSTLTPNQARHLSDVRTYAEAHMSPGFDRSPTLGPRTLAIDVEPDGLRMLWDLAVPGAAAKLQD